jgi:hypothetical protein
MTSTSHEIPNERGRPVWVRPPKPGTLEYYSGFSRAKLYQLEAEGKIRGGSIKGPHQKKGTHLFHLQSILDFVETIVKPAG